MACRRESFYYDKGKKHISIGWLSITSPISELQLPTDKQRKVVARQKFFVMFSNNLDESQDGSGHLLRCIRCESISFAARLRRWSEGELRYGSL
jgi:hypothetical protein